MSTVHVGAWKILMPRMCLGPEQWQYRHTNDSSPIVAPSANTIIQLLSRSQVVRSDGDDAHACDHFILCSRNSKAKFFSSPQAA